MKIQTTVALLLAALNGSHALTVYSPKQVLRNVHFGLSSTDGREIQTSETSTCTPNGPAPVRIGRLAISAALSLAIFMNPSPSVADGQTKDFKLPPIDFSDKNRCVLNSSKMGQANAARDKLYDLRQCDLAKADASGFDLSGVIMTKTNLSGAKLIESYFSKAYLHDSDFSGADFTNGIIDRASFRNSDLKGAIFQNAVLTGTSFEGANVEDADFTEAYIGDFDIRSLCKNPTLKGENPVTGADTRASVGGCR